jgi:hypothetical protein
MRTKIPKNEIYETLCTESGEAAGYPDDID